MKTPEDDGTFTHATRAAVDILEFFRARTSGLAALKDEPRPYEVKPLTIETDLGWSFERHPVRLGCFVRARRTSRA